MKLNVDKDIEIDVEDIQKEFKRMAPLLYRWSKVKSEAELEYEIAKATYEETKAEAYVCIKQDSEKITEKHLESLVNSDKGVKEQRRNMLKAKHAVDTLKGFVEGLRSKKDMLIQVGADLRKE